MSEQHFETEQLHPTVEAHQLLAQAIGDCFEPRSYFPDPTDATKECSEKLMALEETPFDFTQISSQLHERTTAIEDKARLASMQRHRTMLQAGKVLIPGEAPDDYTWAIINSSQRAAFGDVLDTTQKSLEESGPTPKLDPVELQDAEITGILDLLQDAFVPAATEIKAMMPDFSKSHTYFDELDKDVQSMLKLVDLGLKSPGDIMQSFSVFEVDQHHPHIRSLIRKVRKFTSQLDMLLTEPSNYIVDLVVEKSGHLIEADAQNQVNQKVAQANQALLSRLQPVKFTPPQRPVKQVQEMPVEIVQEAPRTCLEATPDPELVPVGVHEFVLPWMNDGQPTQLEVSEIIGAEVPLYVIRAISRRLSRVAQKSRAKYPTAAGQKNRFDEIIEQEVQRIASGIPLHSNGAVNRVRTIDKNDAVSKEYRKLDTIWYNRDRKPNAPRMYFAVSSVSNLVSPETPVTLKADQDCFVVVAETDKARQASVLEKLTGQTHRTVRNAGGGAT